MAKDIEKNQIPKEKPSQSRRTIIKALAGIPVLGVLGYEMLKERAFYPRNETNLISELGLDNLQSPAKISNSAKGELIRIGIIGFGNRAGQLSSALGFLHPNTAKNKRENHIMNISRKFLVGRRHSFLSSRRSLERGRQGPIDLGYLFPQPGQSTKR